MGRRRRKRLGGIIGRWRRRSMRRLVVRIFGRVGIGRSQRVRRSRCGLRRFREGMIRSGIVWRGRIGRGRRWNMIGFMGIMLGRNQNKFECNFILRALIVHNGITICTTPQVMYGLNISRANLYCIHFGLPKRDYMTKVRLDAPPYPEVYIPPRTFLDAFPKF